MSIKTIITGGVATKMNTNDAFNQFVLDAIHRHLSGDWGDISECDMESNNDDPMNALSAYNGPDNTKIWIRQNERILTVLFLDEY